MKRFWRWLFPPNDWIVVWSDSAYWDIQDYLDGRFIGRNRKYCFYRIEYSKYRSKYILNWSGKDPTRHRYIAVAYEKLAEFQAESNR